MNIREKVAYLRGLSEGIEVSSDTKQGKLLKGILDVLGDMAQSFQDFEETQGSLLIYAEELDEDLGILERAFLQKHGLPPDDGNKDRDDDFDIDDDDLEGLDGLYGEDDDDYEYFGDLEGSAKLNCPSCGELLLFDLDDIDIDIDGEGGSIDCPECGEKISVVGTFSSDGGAGCGGCRSHSHGHNHGSPCVDDAVGNKDDSDEDGDKGVLKF